MAFHQFLLINYYDMFCLYISYICVIGLIFVMFYFIDSSQEEFFDVKIISEKLGQFITIGVTSSKELTQSPKVELFHRLDNIIFAIADL